MIKPYLILIDGPMGSGKTTTTKLLNQKLPNTARVALPDIKRLVPNYKEDKKTLKIVREVMEAMIDKYLKHNVSVIVEQVSKSEGIDVLRNLASIHNADFYAYRLTAPKSIRLKRVHERTKDMMGVSKLSQSKVNKLAKYFEPNHQFYLDNKVNTVETIDSSKMNTDEITESIINKLSKRN